MTIREKLEKNEHLILSPKAAFSDAAVRLVEIEKDPIRTEYQRDKDRILHCKSFRRLKHKTQVFLSPEGDHYRTRMTHTLDVSQIARTLARSLQLNEDLAEAIALGHDLGHTPFGHMGERILNELSDYVENYKEYFDIKGNKIQSFNFEKEFKFRDQYLDIEPEYQATTSNLNYELNMLNDKILSCKEDIKNAKNEIFRIESQITYKEASYRENKDIKIKEEIK